MDSIDRLTHLRRGPSAEDVQQRAKREREEELECLRQQMKEDVRQTVREVLREEGLVTNASLEDALRPLVTRQEYYTLCGAIDDLFEPLAQFSDINASLQNQLQSIQMLLGPVAKSSELEPLEISPKFQEAVIRIAELLELQELPQKVKNAVQEALMGPVTSQARLQETANPEPATADGNRSQVSHKLAKKL